ncbi:hypothetical protein ZWY2020_044355 [Hordeum vulgare]|nr:hypothetical protein ZWY2020_044355 [Hordeum vulgare]
MAIGSVGRCSWSTSVRGAHRNVAVGALRLAPILGGAERAKRPVCKARAKRAKRSGGEAAAAYGEGGEEMRSSSAGDGDATWRPARPGGGGEKRRRSDIARRRWCRCMRHMV